MKTKDIIALGLLAVVLFVVGTLLIGQLGGGSKERLAEIEVVEPIDPNFDSRGKELLQNQDQATPTESFNIPLDLDQGFGNTSPFRSE